MCLADNYRRRSGRGTFSAVKFAIAILMAHGKILVANAPVAQWIEQLPSKQWAAGSIPARRAIMNYESGIRTCGGFQLSALSSQ